MSCSCQARAWQYIKSIRHRFLAVVPKGNTKGMAHAFRIRFWEMFSTPGTYDIMTEHQYKLPSSNEGCMWLRANRMSQMELCHRGYWTIRQMATGKHHHRYDMEWSCKARSCPAGYATSSMSTKGSRVNDCPVEQRVQSVYTAHLTVWCGSTDKSHRWCYGCQWASKTCRWLKQTPWRHRCHRWWTNILVHFPSSIMTEGSSSWWGRV